MYAISILHPMSDEESLCARRHTYETACKYDTHVEIWGFPTKK
jgi:hypothetical protein